MVALIPRALEELRGPGKAAVSFEALRTEIDRYLESTSGSAIEIPEWLTRLAREVQRDEPGRPIPDDGEIDSLGENDPVVLRPRQLARRIDRWNRKRR